MKREKRRNAAAHIISPNRTASVYATGGGNSTLQMLLATGGEPKICPKYAVDHRDSA
jgi:hypothetical protein